MAKLFTDHDPNHLHALFGIMNVLHFIFRFRLLLKDVRDVGFGTNWQQDQVSLLLMSLPNATSFVFHHVPVKKGTEDGFTIWKEYRWHAAIFNLRSWLFILFFVLQRHFYSSDGDVVPYHRFVRAGLVFMAMYLAKIATDAYPPQTSTIRGMYKSSFSSFAAGFMQYLGTGMCLIGSAKDDIGVQFYGLSIIQFNAFNMTLRKKRIIGPFSTQLFYSIMLTSGFYFFLVRRMIEDPPTSMFESRLKFVYLASIAYFSRVKMRQSRFMAWIIGLIAVEAIEKQFGVFQEDVAVF